MLLVLQALPDQPVLKDRLDLSARQDPVVVLQATLAQLGLQVQLAQLDRLDLPEQIQQFPDLLDQLDQLVLVLQDLPAQLVE